MYNTMHPPQPHERRGLYFNDNPIGQLHSDRSGFGIIHVPDTNRAQDLAVVLHEVGHYLDRNPRADAPKVRRLRPLYEEEQKLLRVLLATLPLVVGALFIPRLLAPGVLILLFTVPFYLSLLGEERRAWAHAETYNAGRVIPDRLFKQIRRRSLASYYNLPNLVWVETLTLVRDALDLISSAMREGKTR